MKKRNSFIVYLIFIAVIVFCLLTINLFLYFKDLNKLYEDRYRRIDNTYLSYPYFENDKDIHIEKYLKNVDTSKTDQVKYIVNYLGDYINIVFKLYKEELLIDYDSIIFDSNNNTVEINNLIDDENLLKDKVELSIETYKLSMTMNDYEYGKKSYLFKDNELEIYLSNYDEENTISLITINYWEIKDSLKFPYKLDKKYKLMDLIEREDEELVAPIIPNDNIEDKKLIAFTFDDGPSNLTLELLDVLDEFNANSTFFLVGYNVKIRNSVVLDMYNRGFELANHTIDHSRLTKFDCSKANDKINQNEELYNNITNSTMPLLRPPYGSINDKLVECILNPIILWSVDSRDWESRNTEKIVATVLSDIKEGDIVLFHDLYPTTIEAIKVLLPILYADGYKVVSVSELFAANNIQLENHKIYRKAS